VIPPTATPTRQQLKVWKRYLADELHEAATYRDLAGRCQAEERQILLGLAEAEGRHANYWRTLLGDRAPAQPARRLSTALLSFLAHHFGFIFALAMAGRSEARTRYHRDPDVPASMLADEQVHSEVVRALAERGRARISGTFRAAVFGANDGLVSNLALVLGIGASGVSSKVVLLAGIAGLLAGAFSMAAGEYVSVDSQRALLDASNPDPRTSKALPDLDVDENELALVYRARGLSPDEAQARATQVLAQRASFQLPGQVQDHEVVGSGLKAAVASFCFFSMGAIVPVMPYIFGLAGLAAVFLAAGLVGAGLLVTGVCTGILSGTSPLIKGARQVALGWGAAAITYLLGLLFGTTVS
jgi:VIT1/CCC1 family predicted Fe2+/Mn2+ transporter